MTLPAICRECFDCIVTTCSADHKGLCHVQVVTSTGIRIKYEPVDPNAKPPETCQKRKP